MIAVLLAENRLAREGLKALMEKHKNECEVKGEASDGIEAFQKLERIKPDVLLTSIELPGMNGIELARQAREVSPETRVIVCSSKSDENSVLAALRAGAKGYVLETASFDELSSAIHKVHSGGYYLSDEVLRRVVEHYYQGNHNGGRHGTLTSREQEVLRLAREGLTAAEISRSLNISHRTVEAHRFHAMKKLHLRNQTELVRYFMGDGELNKASFGP